MPSLDGRLSAESSLNGSLSQVAGIVGSIDHVNGDIYYEGPFIVVPSSNTQILPTAGTTLSSNIIIKPIPNNYV